MVLALVLVLMLVLVLVLVFCSRFSFFYFEHMWFHSTTGGCACASLAFPCIILRASSIKRRFCSEGRFAHSSRSARVGAAFALGTTRMLELAAAWSSVVFLAGSSSRGLPSLHSF